MKEVIMSTIGVPLIIQNAIDADSSLIDRFISDDLAIRTMQAMASDLPDVYQFDPEYNDIAFVENEEDKEKIY